MEHMLVNLDQRQFVADTVHESLRNFPQITLSGGGWQQLLSYLISTESDFSPADKDPNPLWEHRMKIGSWAGDRIVVINQLTNDPMMHWEYLHPHTHSQWRNPLDCFAQSGLYQNMTAEAVLLLLWIGNGSTLEMLLRNRGIRLALGSYTPEVKKYFLTQGARLKLKNHLCAMYLISEDAAEFAVNLLHHSVGIPPGASPFGSISLDEMDRKAISEMKFGGTREYLKDILAQLVDVGLLQTGFTPIGRFEYLMP